MASGWAREGAVQEQIDDTVNDAVAQARHALHHEGESAIHCQECDAQIPDKRRAALPGVRLCVACQEIHDQENRAGGFNRRGSKDSQLR